MGPMHIESRSGKRFVLVVVDDFSRYFFVSFFKEKSKNPNNIPQSEVDPNKDENISQEDNYEEMGNKHKSKVPKNYCISKVIGKVNERVVARR